MTKPLLTGAHFPRKAGIKQFRAAFFVSLAQGKFRTGFFAASCDTKAGKKPVQAAKSAGDLLCCFANRSNSYRRHRHDSSMNHGSLWHSGVLPDYAALAKYCGGRILHRHRVSARSCWQECRARS